MENKILLIAGCSHAAGSEIDGEQDSFDNRIKSFGGQLAIRLDRRPVNIAIPGATNSSIARSVMKWFESEYDPKKMDVAVLCAWTDSTRIEVPSTQEHVYELSCPNINWMDVTSRWFYRVNTGYHGHSSEEKKMCKYFHKYIAEHENILEIQSINNILMLQYFLKAENISYLFCNSMPVFNLKNPHAVYYQSFVDHTKYLNMHNSEEAFFPKYKNLGYENHKAKYWHHADEAHAHFSTELYLFAKENKCF